MPHKSHTGRPLPSQTPHVKQSCCLQDTRHELPSGGVDKGTLDAAATAERRALAWRDKLVAPWAGTDTADVRSEADLWFDVNATFGMFAELHTESLTLVMSKYNFNKVRKQGTVHCLSGVTVHGVCTVHGTSNIKRSNESCTAENSDT